MSTTSWKVLASGAAFVMVSSALTLAGTLPAAAATCTSGVPGDVNGDGHAEVAITEKANVSTGAGAVHILYGKASGLVADRSGSALDDQYFDQATPGVPGTSEAGDRWGGWTAFGDFDGDGCADLAVGVPGENGGEGALTVLYGSKAGLATSGAKTFTLSGLFGVQDNAAFGQGLAAGDLDDDGLDDLAVGASSYSAGGADLGGAVAVLYGDTLGLGLGATGSDLITRDTAGVPGDPADTDGFGSSLAAGDFDGNGKTELAVTLRDQGADAVQTLRRGPTGYGDAQPAPVLLGERGSGNWVLPLAAGDFDGNGQDDLAVGDPDVGCLECDEEFGYGAVVVLPGSATGLTAAGSVVWTQNSPGVQGTGVPDDGFGFSLAAGPFDGDAVDDLAVGTPSDEGYVGSVTVLLGSSGGLTTAGYGGTLIDQATAGVAGSQGPNSFGASLTSAFVQSKGQANLIVGAYTDSIGKYRGTGRIVQLAIQPSGPKASTSRSFDLDSAGVKGKPTKYAGFGARLS